jgi:hypothetical protein
MLGGGADLPPRVGRVVTWRDGDDARHRARASVSHQLFEIVNDVSVAILKPMIISNA